MKYYLAARFSRIKQMRAAAVRLQDLGHTVTSRWVWRTDKNLEDLYSNNVSIIATEDLEDVAAADCVILFCEPPRRTKSRGGRLVEFGAGIGFGKKRFIVGPRENIFCCLPDVKLFDCWQELDRYLTRREIAA